jgi:hypothetical protein
MMYSERHGRHGIDKQFADGDIDLGTEDALARRITEESAPTDAHIRGDEMTAKGRIGRA